MAHHRSRHSTESRPVTEHMCHCVGYCPSKAGVMPWRMQPKGSFQSRHRHRLPCSDNLFAPAGDRHHQHSSPHRRITATRRCCGLSRDRPCGCRPDVTGAGLATLAGGLQAHRPDLLDGVGLIVGIDRFMSEARAVTNFSGNAVATILVGSWTKTVDRSKVDAVLRGADPFNELTMVDDRPAELAPKEAVAA